MMRGKGRRGSSSDTSATLNSSPEKKRKHKSSKSKMVLVLRQGISVSAVWAEKEAVRWPVYSEATTRAPGTKSKGSDREKLLHLSGDGASSKRLQGTEDKERSMSNCQNNTL